MDTEMIMVPCADTVPVEPQRRSPVLTLYEWNPNEGSLRSDYGWNPAKVPLFQPGVKIIIIMYIYHALINALSAHMIHINIYHIHM